MLKINEIFYSIQGEAHNTGMPVVFVRFSGCNLKCKWCDTEHKTYAKMTEDEIVKKIKTYGCNNVIFTGGEPTIQNIDGLHKKLLASGYWVGLETNGTNVAVLFDWVTVSPKSQNNLECTVCEECKVVWTGKEDLGWFRTNIYADYYYLQPCFVKDDPKATMINIREVIEIVKKNPDWRLSAQVHKLINIR